MPIPLSNSYGSPLVDGEKAKRESWRRHQQRIDMNMENHAVGDSHEENGLFTYGDKHSQIKEPVLSSSFDWS